MGAFFLHKVKCEIDRQAVENVFMRKGFTETPIRRNLGEWVLWLYRKQLIETDNYIENNNGFSVYATGTVVYKGLNYYESLHQLLEDFVAGSIENDRLIGTFCLLFWDRRCITFLTDEMNMHHIFIDEKRSRISTSFLVLLSSHTEKLKINRLGFFEKLATGYILSPDTLVKGIQQVDEKLKRELNNECSGLAWMKGRQNTDFNYSFHDKGFKDSIERQFAVLKSYFGQVDNLHGKYHGELGLSSGYDSRLLLAGGGCFLGTPLAIHTHSTIGIHNFERRIAEEIARMKKLQIRSFDTTQIEKHDSDKVHELLLESLYFFDARCCYDMGAYSETYTGSYKKRVLGQNRLSFNGLGGEIFRNYLNTSIHDFDTLEWMKSHLYYYYAEEALKDPQLFDQIHSNIISKLGKRLNADVHRKMTFFETRRYYSEVRMPDCDAINHNAQNQIAFYLTPFTESMVFTEAIKATPYIGSHGKYQAELIRSLDSSLASVQSHYGFPFDRIPISYSALSFVKGYIPYKIRNLRHRYFKKRGRGEVLLQNYIKLKKRSEYLNEIEKTFSLFIKPFNWQAAMRDNLQKPTTIFLSSFLHEFSNKLSR